MLTVQQIIKNQVIATEQFPVDFNEYWQWLGYSKKENAKRAFLNCDFEKGFDFELLISEESVNHDTYSAQEKAVLAKTEIINLTVDCAKSFAMMARTEKGKEIRKWYLEIEKELRDIKNKPKTYKMSLSQIDWIADRMVAEGALLPEDKLDFKLDKAIENFPEMASGIADARKLVADKNKANADYAIACQQKQKQLLFSDFTKQLNRLATKKGKKALLTSDLTGLSLMQRKDFLEKYGAKDAKRLNKPEILVIWQEMHDLGLGNFDKVAGTFETAVK
jgi:phage anti-repressor protein